MLRRKRRNSVKRGVNGCRVGGGCGSGWGITWSRRLKGRQDVNVSLFIIALRKVGQLG